MTNEQRMEAALRTIIAYHTLQNSEMNMREDMNRYGPYAGVAKIVEHNETSDDWDNSLEDIAVARKVLEDCGLEPEE